MADDVEVVAGPPSAKRLFAVSTGEYSDYRVLCACPTEEDGEQVAAKLRGRTDVGFGARDARVEPLMLVTGDVQPVEVLRLSTTPWDDGREDQVVDEARREWEFHSIFPTVPMHWRWVRAPIHDRQGGGGRLDVCGTNHELVRKTYSDKRAQALADVGFRMMRESQGLVI